MEFPFAKFGSEIPGRDYILRPGSYGVIRNQSGFIAVVRTPSRLFLPGGGQERGESPEAALVRETMEECGLAIRNIELLGAADEFVHDEKERMSFLKRCTFFKAEVEGDHDTHGREADHQLRWVAEHDAISQLVHESHRWAVKVSRIAG